jgi:NitT/TauT family transport system substrate-binding protein
VKSTKTFSSKPLSRRSALALSVGAVATGALGFPSPALVQTRKKIKMAYGVPTIDSSDAAFFSSIPIGAGFFAEEGLDVKIMALNGATAAVNMLANGQVQFTTHGNAGLFSGVGQGVPFKAFICQVVDNFYSIAVLDGSPIKSVTDLKGKTIGVPALGGSTFVLMSAIARALKWDAKKDFQFLATGVGLPALDALQKDRVQALFIWDTPFAVFEANGAKLRYFRPDPLPQLGMTHTTNASLEMLEKDPQTVAAMSRAFAKSLIFAATAPYDEIAKLHLKIYPSSRAPGLTMEQWLDVDRRRFEARSSFMRFKQRVFSREEKLGDETDQRITNLRDLLYEGGEIKEAAPVDKYFTRQFLGEINGVNFEETIAKAKKFRVT